MLRAEEYKGSVGVGVTSPRLFRANDGQVYVVKLQRNKLGAKILANELLAAKLGEKMQLCFPKSGIIELGTETISQSPALVRAGIAPGRQFACLYLPQSYYVDRSKLAKAVNKQQMAGVMLFDHLLHNVDRTWNRKNLLIRREQEGPVIYAIDNSHLFVKGRWTVESLRKLADSTKVNHRRSYGVLLKYYLQPADFRSYAERMVMLSDDDLRSIVNSIPQEWLPCLDERAALVDHLIVRRELVPVICRSLCDLIPDVHRCAKYNKQE